MTGHTYSSFTPTNACYIITGPEDGPTGFYRGIVITVTPATKVVKGQPRHICAIVDDVTVENTGTEPKEAYSVIPYNPDTILLVDHLRRLEKRIVDQKLAIGSLEYTVVDVATIMAAALR